MKFIELLSPVEAYKSNIFKQLLKESKDIVILFLDPDTKIDLHSLFMKGINEKHENRYFLEYLDNMVKVAENSVSKLEEILEGETFPRVVFFESGITFSVINPLYFLFKLRDQVDDIYWQSYIASFRNYLARIREIWAGFPINSAIFVSLTKQKNLDPLLPLIYFMVFTITNLGWEQLFPVLNYLKKEQGFPELIDLFVELQGILASCVDTFYTMFSLNVDYLKEILGV